MWFGLVVRTIEYLFHKLTKRTECYSVLNFVSVTAMTFQSTEKNIYIA